MTTKQIPDPVHGIADITECDEYKITDVRFVSKGDAADIIAKFDRHLTPSQSRALTRSLDAWIDLGSGQPKTIREVTLWTTDYGSVHLAVSGMCADEYFDHRNRWLLESKAQMITCGKRGGLRANGVKGWRAMYNSTLGGR